MSMCSAAGGKNSHQIEVAIRSCTICAVLEGSGKSSVSVKHWSTSCFQLF